MASANPANNPKNVGIIMDGNGRWAKQNSMITNRGHEKGVAVVKEVVKEAVRQKLQSLTLYAFSTENWSRPKKEISGNFKKESFSYKDLPVIPFTAPRTKKLKIINFSKKIDSEIYQLVNVFKSLKLNPDNINLEKIENYLKKIELNVNNEELIEDTSLRFQFLEELKNAIIFLPLKPPMQYYYVSSPYGFRIHPKSKLRQMHHGIDMAGTWQEEVRAPADGYVSFSGRNGSFGKSIKIVHKHGVTTLYGHLHRLKVKKGDFVTEGDIIGKMGSTGRAVGAHLHYEIKVNKKSVNPYNFISIGRELLSSSIIRN